MTSQCYATRRCYHGQCREQYPFTPACQCKLGRARQNSVTIQLSHNASCNEGTFCLGHLAQHCRLGFITCRGTARGTAGDRRKRTPRLAAATTFPGPNLRPSGALSLSSRCCSTPLACGESVCLPAADCVLLFHPRIRLSGEEEEEEEGWRGDASENRYFALGRGKELIAALGQELSTTDGRKEGRSHTSFKVAFPPPPPPPAKSPHQLLHSRPAGRPVGMGLDEATAASTMLGEKSSPA